jgi:tetratricopeptide (TPR) repeat protein
VDTHRNKHFQIFTQWTMIVLVLLSLSLPVVCQSEDSFGDAAADPTKLFEQGQSAHARGEIEKALEFYERAIQVKPEFPEAEFQRGNALVSLGRLTEARTAFDRAIALRKNWSMPYSALGALLFREGKDQEAEKLFRLALEYDAKNNVALRMLAEIRLRAGDPKEALSLAQSATRDPEAGIASWVIRAMAERMTGDKKAAQASLEHALQVDSDNLAALLERVELRIDEGQYDLAIADLNHAVKLRPGDKQILSRMVFAYERAGRTEEAQRVAQSAGLVEVAPQADGTIKVIGTSDEIAAANSDDPVVSRKALEELLKKNPQNAMLAARLGASFRTENPARSLEYYRRAAEMQPDNAEYAAGYAAALVQARRFGEAAAILRKVIGSTPNNYTAHANLATALYELKRYGEALPEYQWLLNAKPDLAVAHYFIATAHDYLGEYVEALSAYEIFLARADSTTNQLEIDKVKLRLPSLRKQIQLGQGAKRKKSN